MNDEDPKAVVPLGMSYKGLSSFYYVCVYEQKINVVALIVSMVQVPSTSAQLIMLLGNVIIFYNLIICSFIRP